MPNSKDIDKYTLEGWDKVDWTSIQTYVRKLQKRIYKFSKLNEIRQVRKYQNILIDSWQAKLLSTRKVTQDNQGKKTAGVDGIKSLQSQDRFLLAKSLTIPTKAKPLRRVWVPKPGKVEKRPLGIPTIRDRVLQALLKLALEPEWEARFEPNSYGFRPGRNCHDAIKAILFSIQKRNKYVLDADIKKCFDQINHKALLDKIGMTGSIRTQLQYWLEAGVLDNDVFTETEMGTPQGGVISPLLANIALHGLETRIKDFVETIPDKYPGGGTLNKRDRRNSVSVIRYADDFVIMHHNLEVVQHCQQITEAFLMEIGLSLNKEKTRITHTLELSEQEQEKLGVQTPGFDFLGFTIRQYKTKYKSANVAGRQLGYRTVVVPSQDKINKHQFTLRNILARSRNIPQHILITKLNKIISGWARYFAKSDASTEGILQKLDYLLYLKLRKWAKAVSKDSKQGSKFWRSTDTKQWMFVSQQGPALVSYLDFSLSINNYVKVRGEWSPYDENDNYWAARLGINPIMSASKAKLLQIQKGRCNWCHQVFDNDDVLEVDHIVPKALGGKDAYANLQILHRHCHDAKTKQDGSLSQTSNLIQIESTAEDFILDLDIENP